MHALVVCQGQYKAAATGLAAETFAFGTRWVVGLATPSPVGVLPSDTTVAVVPKSIAMDETDWTIEGNWTWDTAIGELDPSEWLNSAIAPSLVTFWGTSNLFAAGTYFKEIKVYPIGSNGKTEPAPPYAAGSPCTLTFKTETACGGAGSGTQFPPQVALVASLRTAQVGPHGRGRIFLPGAGAALSSSYGLVDPTRQASVTTAAAAFFEGCTFDDALGGPTAYPAVVPAAQSAPTAYALVNQIRVGSVFDTQRRRRRSLVETYTTAAVSGP